MILDHESDSLNNVPDKAKQRINAIVNHSSDFEIMCNRSITSVANTLKNIHLNYDLFDEVFTTLYNDKSAVFEYCSRDFTINSVNNISHRYLLKEQDSNLYEAVYDKNVEDVFGK